MHVTVCICTFRRPALLKRLLDSLRDQHTAGTVFSYSVVVADNDRLQSARAAVAEMTATFPVPLAYCTEPRQNIALTRNCAIAHARGDWIAFIDDDEFPAPDWLSRLVSAADLYGSDGVLGPVQPHFDEPPPAWLVKGRFCERPTHATGQVLDAEHCRTGNALLKREMFAGGTPPFRPEFGGGGEDRDFFRRMIAEGRRFVWCNEASVFEVVPPARWRRSFLLRRALLRGKMSLSDPNGRLSRVALSLVAIPFYALVLPFLGLTGQHNVMKGLIRLCDHAGRLLAVVHLNPIKEAYVTE